jgi:agmatine deiminase
MLEAAGVATERVAFHEVPTDDAWIRDHGPVFLTRPVPAGDPLALVDWRYNAWGGKYPPWDQDDRVPGEIARILGVPVFEPGIVLEGGSIDVNGRGTLITTESCLLNPNRNPGLRRRDIEQVLRSTLGVSNVLWLGDGIAGDDTDGHVDDLARFVDPVTVVAAVESDPEDDNHAALADNLRRLESMSDEAGRRLRVVCLPMPRPVLHDGTRLPASYVNFYIANTVVLVPLFDDPADAEALAVLRSLFPGRRVVGIAATDLVLGLGAFHCVTQQGPAVTGQPRVGGRGLPDLPQIARR